MLAREAERSAARREHEQPGRGGEQARDELHVAARAARGCRAAAACSRSREAGGEHVLDGLARLARAERLGERGAEQRRVADGGEVDEDRAVAQLRPELRGGREREPRLSRAARTGERDEPHVVAPEERRDRRHLEAAAHERSRRRGEPQAGRLGRLRSRERRVVAQDPALELLELRAGIDAELLEEQLPRGPARRERVHLPAGAVERERMLDAKALAVRLGGDQPLELRHELVVPAEGELSVVAKLERAQPPLLELRRLRLVDGLARKVGERRADPERQARAADPPPPLPARPAARAAAAVSTSRSNRARSSSPGSSRSR